MSKPCRIEAQGGLAFAVDGAGRARVEWGAPDWLGAIGARFASAGAACEPAIAATRAHAGADALGAFASLDVAWSESPLAVRTSLRAYAERPLLVFRIEAAAALAGFASGRFDEPSVAWPWLRPALRAPGGVPDDTRVFGHQYTEFALPAMSSDDCAGFFLLPFRPAVAMPLLFAAPDGRTLLLAPLGAFHEQVIAVPRDRAGAAAGVRCGWHGDLDQAPAGFASELALWAGPSPRACLDAWAGFLRERHRTVRPGRYADRLGAQLSYWTDNGAAYWYRTEPGRGGVAGTLAAKADEMRREGVPFGIFQLDSWFYPHRELRPFDAPDVSVPPTGLVTWDARPDVLPGGIPALRRALGDPPLAAHCRHFASDSPYFALHEAWVDGDRAHPQDAALYGALLHQAAGWGVEVFEHDWLVECFLGVRGLREAPGRARAWQEGVDRAAGEHGVTLQWCMASPADFFQSVTLKNVTSIRTSGDYKYFVGSGALWAWFLYGNALARALGLHPFKDVFLTRRDGDGPRDGDPHAEAEALLAALSAGPVGIGDRVGRTERELLWRTCRRDGVLVKPDAPIAALDRCFRAHAVLEPAPLAGATHSAHTAGRWSYVASFHAANAKETLRFRLGWSELGPDAPDGPCVAYGWRSGRMERSAPDGGVDLALAPLAWDFRVLAPILPGDVAIVGDPALYATAGDRRIADVRAIAGGVRVDVLGAPGEAVRIRGWAARRPAGAEALVPGARHALDVAWDAASGRFDLDVAIPAGGCVQVRVACG
ncbi:MAG: hypothetical protein DCC71_18415 [Proteobacteria bacterium]|nr:MAG: hypothetical protein DCC71_18415 [Pseudomonadota bacterium]